MLLKFIISFVVIHGALFASDSELELLGNAKHTYGAAIDPYGRANVDLSNYEQESSYTKYSNTQSCRPRSILYPTTAVFSALSAWFAYLAINEINSPLATQAFTATIVSNSLMTAGNFLAWFCPPKSLATYLVPMAIGCASSCISNWIGSSGLDVGEPTIPVSTFLNVVTFAMASSAAIYEWPKDSLRIINYCCRL